jgi:hypothetical protein
VDYTEKSVWTHSEICVDAQRNLCELHRKICVDYTEKSVWTHREICVDYTEKSVWTHREICVNYTEKSVWTHREICVDAQRNLCGRTEKSVWTHSEIGVGALGHSAWTYGRTRYGATGVLAVTPSALQGQCVPDWRQSPYRERCRERVLVCRPRWTRLFLGWTGSFRHHITEP